MPTGLKKACGIDEQEPHMRNMSAVEPGSDTMLEILMERLKLLNGRRPYVYKEHINL